MSVALSTLASAPVTRMEWLAILRKNLEALFFLGEQAQLVYAAKTAVGRWEAFKPAGDVIAPMIDEVLTLRGKLGEGSFRASSTLQSEDEVLVGIREAYVEYEVRKAVSGMVVASSADADEKADFQASRSAIAEDARTAATAKALKFDGKWLALVLKLLELAPLFMK